MVQTDLFQMIVSRQWPWITWYWKPEKAKACCSSFSQGSQSSQSNMEEWWKDDRNIHVWVENIYNLYIFWFSHNISAHLKCPKEDINCAIDDVRGYFESKKLMFLIVILWSWIGKWARFCFRNQLPLANRYKGSEHDVLYIPFTTCMYIYMYWVQHNFIFPSRIFSL